MHCPRCHSEYRDGFTVCSDCAAPLSLGPPPVPVDTSSPAPDVTFEVVDLVPILHTNDISEADIAVSILAGEGIQAVARSWTPGGLFAWGIEGATFPVQAAAVCVPRPFVAEAREILSAMLGPSELHVPTPAPPSLGPSSSSRTSPLSLAEVGCLLQAAVFLAFALVTVIRRLLR